MVGCLSDKYKRVYVLARVGGREVGRKADALHQSLGTTAALGLYQFKVGDQESSLTASALLGARYTF